VEGVYRVRLHDGRDLLEWFVAGPGPLGFRWFGRIREPGSDDDLRLVDHTVDRWWRLVRFRLIDLEAGVEMVATPDPSGIGVSRAGGFQAGDWVVSGAEAVWSDSPSAPFVLGRLAAASRVPVVTAATVDPGGTPRAASIRIGPLEGSGPEPAGTRAELAMDVDGSRISVIVRDGWPVRADGRFELL
jgi:hypothetical protein